MSTGKRGGNTGKSCLRAISRRVLLLAYLVLLLASVLPSPQAKAEVPAHIGRIRWAYYVAYASDSLTSLQQHIGDLDYLSPDWFEVDANGNIARKQGVSDENLSLVTSLARANGVKVLPIVKNGATGSSFHGVLADATLRGRAVGNILDTLVGGGWQGVNIDFENLDASDRTHLTAFMADLAAALRPRGKIVTQAIAAREEEKLSGWTGVYDYAGLAPHSDLLLLMSYGYRTSNSSVPGPVAPINWVERTVEYAVSQIPPSKLILGVPWYGYDWNRTTGPPARAIRYPEALELAQRYGSPILYDSSQSPYFTYAAAGQQHEVWFEDRRSLEYKLDLVNKYGLAGAGGWRMGHEDPGVWDCFNARLAFRTWYLAEGCTSYPYHTWILIMNPNGRPAQVTVAFMKEDGSMVTKQYRVGAASRFSIFANEVVPNAAFSTKVQSDLPIFVERAMYFNADGHDSAGVNGPSRTWYLPEGFAGQDVDTWILLMNPNSVAATATVTFMKEDGATVVRSYNLASTSRLNVWADQIVPNCAFSTKVEATLPIVAERAMYFVRGGHGSVGVSYASKKWYLAEGYSGFGSWLLLMNPNSAAANVAVTFMLEDGSTVLRNYTLRPTSRLTIYVNDIIPNVAFSTKVESDQPIVAERAMYWGNSPAGHSSLGATALAQTWYLPEGCTARPFEEWVLVMNPGTTTANVTATYMMEGANNVVRKYTVAPTSRLTIHVDEIIGDCAVSVRLDSDRPIAAERSMYFGNGGHNSVGVSQ